MSLNANDGAYTVKTKRGNVPLEPEKGDSIETRLVKAEINSLMLDMAVDKQISRSRETNDSLLGILGDTSSDKKRKKEILRENAGLNTIEGMHKTLLASIPEFEGLDQRLKVLMLYITQKVGFVGIKSMTPLWEAVSKGDLSTVIDLVTHSTHLNIPSKNALICLLRSFSDVK